MNLKNSASLSGFMLLLVLTLPLHAGGQGEETKAPAKQMELNGVVTVLGSAFDASLALALDDRSRAKLKSMGINAQHIFLVGTAYPELFKLQNSIVTVEGTVLTLAEWQKLDNGPVPKLMSPKIQHVLNSEKFHIVQ